ncbi:MAG: putative transposase [Thermosipho sp. (in: thermotogales)]|jgi:putative transposase|nr:putative transposase [Thermosipho sp. (in: thermotogales)]
MEECKILGIQQIFTSYNNERGSANIERYFRTYKEEVVWPVEEMSYSELVVKTKKYEKFYNSRYPHSALKYRSPREGIRRILKLHKSFLISVQFFGVYYRFQFLLLKIQK